MKVDDNEFPKLIFEEVAAPATPAAGTVVVYAKADGLIYGKDDAGVETALSGGGGGVSDGDKGDITVSSSGAAWDIDAGVVTYAKIQDISATQRVLGRNTAGAGDTEEVTLSQLLDWIGSAAQGDILYRGAATWARLAAGTNGHFLQTQGTGANPQWAAATATMPVGSVIKSAYTAAATVASNASTTIPFDNTIPQNTEGDAYTDLDTTITPTEAASMLDVEVVFPLVSGNGTIDLTFALFRDSTADAIAVESITIDASNYSRQAVLRTRVAAGSTSATTFKVRWGRSGGTGYINRTTGSANLFGGVLKATMSVKEIKQ